MYNMPMQIKKIFSHPGFILLNWFVFVFFLVVVLPAVSYAANQMGLSPSIDTNFSFDPTAIYSILNGYGESGRAFYLFQRWTFDAIWPMVYGFPIFFTLKLWLGHFKNPLIQLFIFLPLIAMTFDYFENITFSIMIILYPMESNFLAYLGVGISLLKWIALGVALMSVTLVSVVVLIQTIIRVVKSR
jgi:hypothetical protein